MSVPAFDDLDMSSELSKKHYKERLSRVQSTLNVLQRRAREREVPLVLVFEGWDAAGKGGVIRRLVPAFDVRDVRVMRIAAPTEEERRYHYMWRFWRKVPRAGKIVIFDRSWYGRVLVERIENLAPESAWRRAYSEIRDFEEQLVEHGVVLEKFWLHITPEEQAKRFQDREQTPHKRYKLTDDDWRNRARWTEYEQAVVEMIHETHRRDRRWHLMPANDKRFARIDTLETVAHSLAAALD